MVYFLWLALRAFFLKINQKIIFSSQEANWCSADTTLGSRLFFQTQLESLGYFFAGKNRKLDHKKENLRGPPRVSGCCMAFGSLTILSRSVRLTGQTHPSSGHKSTTFVSWHLHKWSIFKVSLGQFFFRSKIGKKK